jgi:preprotein translocase subunit SecF
MKTTFWIIGILTQLCLTALLACLPALPFWYFGHTLAGCFIYALVGLPVGTALSLSIIAGVMAVWYKGDDDNTDGDDDDNGDKTPPSSHNRISQFFPSRN